MLAGHGAMTIYYHVYLQQYGKYLEVDLIDSKATNRKQEKFSYLRWRLNPKSLSSEPSHPHKFASSLSFNYKEIPLVHFF